MLREEWSTPGSHMFVGNLCVYLHNVGRLVHTHLRMLCIINKGILFIHVNEFA